MKKILFDLGHPHHYHLFKNVIAELDAKGWGTYTTYQKKDVLEKLLYGSVSENFNIFPEGRKKNNIAGLFYSYSKRMYRMYQLCRKEKFNLLVGTSLEICHLGRLLGIPAINVNDDDCDAVPLYSWLSYPFSPVILAPAVTRTGRWKDKTVGYAGYQELAYLYPGYFSPDRKTAARYVDIEKPYFLIRFVKLTAHHDRGIKGINDDLALKIIKVLEPWGNVYITSERELDSKFEKYRIDVDPLDMHHILNYAKMFIGDSQTMVAEAAEMGVPAVRYNDFVGKISYLEDLEHTYGLTFGIKTAEPEKLLAKITELLHINDIEVEWAKRRRKMLDERINVSKFFVWFFENYPSSHEVMKKNPDYQYNFR